MPCLTAYPGVAAYLPGANARERCEPLSVSDTTNRCYLLGRVHFGSEGGGPNGNMASCLGGGLKVLELQLHST